MATIDKETNEVFNEVVSDEEDSPRNTPVLDKEKFKRYSYLLGKSELFSQFIKLGAGETIEDYTVNSSKVKNGSDARHRKTEEEEDAELANQVEDEDVNNFIETPFYINGKMRDYQLQGLNWIISLYENGLNGILADEMGLGKTLQVISFLGYLKTYRKNSGPHLVIVPKTTLHNWKKEFEKWFNDMDVFIFHGSKDERPKLVAERLKPVNFEVCITSYEMCNVEKATLKKINWEYIVIDEAHRIKNEESLLSKLVRIFKSKYRLLVTGTPLQNNLRELWALLNFLLPDVFGDHQQFENWVTNQSGDQDSIVKQLHKILQPFLLRRIKLEVEKSLLPKIETNLYVGMSEMQRKWYKKLLERDIAAVNGAVAKNEGSQRFMNIVMQLRKCCNHPYLFDGAEPGPPYTTDEHLIENTGKMVLLDKLLKHYKEQGSQVLIFSTMSRMVDIIEDYCTFRNYGFCRIDGQTSHEDRIEAIDEFSRPDSDKFVFLLTTRAGGLGINLVTANVVIIYDSDWNPQVDLQAMDRAHRIGQTKQVYVYRFITENAVEEKVIEKATQKLRLDQLVIQQGRTQQTKSKTSTKQDLISMIQHGAEDIFNSTQSNITDTGIEEIIRKGAEKTKELNAKYQQLGLEDLQKFTLEGTGSALLWQGEDYAEKRKTDSGYGFKWINPAKRERKANYNIDTYYHDALKVGGKTKEAPKIPRPIKHVTIHDFQFYPKELPDLIERELLHYHRLVKFQSTEEDLEKRSIEQAKIDSAEPLTSEEVELKNQLLLKGFSNWNRKDYRAFLSAMERHGRDNFKQICEDVEGKTLEEIKTYHSVFWKRFNELSDYERILDTINRGEERLRKNSAIINLLRSKISSCSAPLVQVKLPLQSNRSRFFSEEEDRFLIVMMDKHGYGQDDCYDRIRDEIRLSPLFRFNWFFKSRTASEIGRRCTTLVNALLKEMNDDELANANNYSKGKRVKIN